MPAAGLLFKYGIGYVHPTGTPCVSPTARSTRWGVRNHNWEAVSNPQSSMPGVYADHGRGTLERPVLQGSQATLARLSSCDFGYSPLAPHGSPARRNYRAISLAR